MKLPPQWVKFRLRTKLTLLIEGLVVILVLATGIITTLREKETLESELRKRGLALASDLAKFTARPLLSQDLPTLRRFVNHTMEQDYVRYVIVIDPHGNVVMHSDLAEVGKTYKDNVSIAAANAKDPGCTHLSRQGELYCDIFTPIQVSDVRLGTVRLGYSYLAVEKEIAKARQQIFIIGIVTIIIGGVVAYLLATFISLPIKKITDATEKVTSGDLITRLAIKRDDEIGTLANSFNKMTEDLAKHHKHLEELVDERTSELEITNVQLMQEITERKRAEEELKQSRERLRDLASHLQSIREEEGRRIAREIHDELGQALTALKMDIHWIDYRLPGDQPLLLEKTKTMSKLVDITIQSVRRISSELRPGLLDDFGLSAAIEWQTNEFNNRTGIQCNTVSDPEDIVLDRDCSIAVFRIFQETLTNIARHANATAVEVILKKKSGKVELRVHDNGIGITEKQVSDGRSFGIIGMRERVHYLGGDLIISSARNKGTTVKASIPISKKGENQ
jgi:signal transduction histidine kinase